MAGNGRAGSGLVKMLAVLAAIAIGGAGIYLWISGNGNPPPGPGPGPAPADPAADDGEFVYQPAELKPLDPAKIVVDEQLHAELVKDQILVTLHKGVAEADLQKILDGLELPAAIVGRIPSFNMLQLEVDADERHRVRQKLANHPFVATASYNFIERQLKTFNDPVLSNQDAVDDWGIQRISAPTAWDITTVGATIAVVDSGTLVEHEDLSGKIVEPYSYATQSSAMQYQKYLDNRGNTSFVTGHGTHVAGTAGGIADNAAGTVGIAPGSPIMPIQVLYFIKDFNSVGGSTAEIVDGIARAIGKGAKVVNLSIGRVWPETLLQRYKNGTPAEQAELEQNEFMPAVLASLEAYKPALDQADKSGVILVKAAANDAIPAKFDTLSYSKRVISVAATNRDDGRAVFSNYGEYTTVSAPGVEIYSAYPDPGNQYKMLQGTSMACPHVAGLVGLMKGVKPDLTRDEAIEILLATGMPLTTDLPIGPLVNAEGALAEAKQRADAGTPPPQTPPPLIPPPPVTPPPVSPPPETSPPESPTPDEIISGPEPWKNPQVQNLIDLWLSIATPPLEPVPGFPWYYDEYGRALNDKTAWANHKPIWAGYRYRFLWQHSKQLDSTRHGTLYEFIVGMLKNGRFDPAPPKLPAPPDGKTPGIVAKAHLGKWSGGNGRGDKLAVDFAGGVKVVLDRAGRTETFVHDIDYDRQPPHLDLYPPTVREEAAPRTKFLVAFIDKDTLHLRSDFNDRRPLKLSANDPQTFVLTRTSGGDGDGTDPGKRPPTPPTPGKQPPIAEGFQPKPATVVYQGSSTILVGGPDDPKSNHTIGSSLQVGGFMSIADFALSGDGKVAWMTMYDPYAEEGQPRWQVWSINTDGSNPQLTEVPLLEKTQAMTIGTTQDARQAFITVRGYEDKQYVNAFYRAEPGSVAQLVTTTATQTEKELQTIHPSLFVTPQVVDDGSAIYFTAGGSIWRINPAAGPQPQKIVEKKSITLGGVEARDGFSALKVSGDGSRWVARMTFYVPEKRRNVFAVATGSTAGGGAILDTDEALAFSYVSISDDGKRIAYTKNRKTYLAENGNIREVLAEANDTHAPVLSGNGRMLYAVAGRMGTSTQHGSFVESLETGQRRQVQCRVFAGPIRGGYDRKELQLSDDGSIIAGMTNIRPGIGAIRNGLYVQYPGVVDPSGYPKISDLRYGVDDEDHLVIRAHVESPDELYQVFVQPLKNGYVDPVSFVPQEENPLFYFRAARPLYAPKDKPNDFELKVKLKPEQIAAIDATYSFRIVAVNKPRNRVVFQDFVAVPQE